MVEIEMSGCSTSVSTQVQDPNHQNALLQHKDDEEEKNEGVGNDNGNVNDEEDEDEDVDFNPFLKETNSLEPSSSLSSEVEDLDTDVADSGGIFSAVFVENAEGRHIDVTKDFHISGNIEHGEDILIQNTVSSGDITDAAITERRLASNAHSENGLMCDKENGSTSLTDVNPMGNMDVEGAICMRTRARYSLANCTLDELETFLQETDDEDDLQNVDDEEEYRKFLAAVLIGDDSQNLQGIANADDEDEENDADFELELEEALESEPDEVEERRMTRRIRRQKASVERGKKLSGQSNRPLRPLLPFASSIGSFSHFDGRHPTPNIPLSYMPPVNNGFTSSGFTPHQIGQLHCLIHEHVQLLIQVFSVCVLEPGRNHIAAEVKELIFNMLQKRDQVLAWRTLPYPSFCFLPPYVHPSVPDELHKSLPPNGRNKSVCRDSSGSDKHLPDKQAGSFQTLEGTSWLPYICGPVMSVIDVAPLRLVENYVDDVSTAVKAYERYQIELGSETPFPKEPLFPLQSSAEPDGHGEMGNAPPDSSTVPSSSSSNQTPKKTVAATLLEKAKHESVALVPKDIAKFAQRFWPLFNHALYPRKPPPAPLVNRVLFTDAEDDLLALGLMECNTDWKGIQHRFLPCKSRHQIFVRQKNRASSKAPENPIKAVRRMKNSPLTSEEIACIEVGLKRFKLDWISIWRFYLPYRDPSLLPRLWRIACGTQKSYKSDATKNAKRRLCALRRKTSKPSASTLHSSSEKEGDSTDNAIEETNDGYNRMNKEDGAYVHEAFLADWRPDNNVSLNCPTHLPSQEGYQGREQNDNSGSGGFQLQMCSKSPAALRSSDSQVVLRPYRARRINTAARMVKLAPNLPPLNLPPSVRVISQSAFKSSQAKAPTKSGIDLSAKSGQVMSNNVKITTSNNQLLKHHEVVLEKRVAERGDSDLQMHPLLFQAPQDSCLPYYPLNCSASTSSSFTFFSGKQPQLSLGPFHNPRHIKDAVNYLSKSSKPPEKNASPFGVDFHPLLQRTDDVDTESRQRLNPSASGTKVTGPSRKVNELDLDIHLSFTSKNQEAVESRNMTIESESARDCAPVEIIDSGDPALVASREKISLKVSDNTGDESLPEIIMEQEELSDSEEEFGENVEFEHEEMADSEGESTSDSDKFVNIPNEEKQLDEMDANIDNHRVENACSKSKGLELAEKGVNNMKPDALSLNLNSCPNPTKNAAAAAAAAVADYEFGKFGKNQVPATSKRPTRHTQKKRARDSGETVPRKPRKRACRSNSKSNSAQSGKGNSSSNVDISKENLKNVNKDELG